MESLPQPGRRTRRLHSDEFKVDAVAAATQPGVSMASVALARGINANLLRRWVREAELPLPKALTKPAPTPATAATSFVPVRMPQPASTATGDIRIEVRRGATTITVAWPMAAASECATWMRDLLA
jgi:transposase-like protein